MIDYSTKITDFSGNVINDDITMLSNGNVPVPLTLGGAIRHALCLSTPEDKDLAGSEKFRRAKLAFDIDDAKTALKSDDITLIKKLIGRIYGPVVVYRVYLLLDPAEAN